MLSAPPEISALAPPYLLTSSEAGRVNEMCIDLPLVTVQHDYQDVLADVLDKTVQQDKFWISCFRRGSPSIHSSVAVALSGSHPPALNYSPEGGLTLSKLNNAANVPFQVSCAALQIDETPLQSPRLSVRVLDNQPTAIPTFDISPDGQLLATGHQDGSIWVRNVPSLTTSDHSKVERHAIIHKADVSVLRFFPSSKVLLSASADFSLRIISADDLSIVPRSLLGHRRPVTGTVIIDKGRNVLSCSKDGTIRLWDCSTGSQISLISVESYSPIRGMGVGTRSEEIGAALTPSDTPSRLKPNEIATGDKMVFCALQSGTIEVIDLASKSMVLRSPSVSNQSSLSAISYSETAHMLAVGSNKGVLTLYDIRAFAKPLFSCRRNEAAIEDLQFLPQSNPDDEVKLVVTTHDGLPFVASVRPEGPIVSKELIGYDCDPCRTVRCVNDAIWVAGDDGVIRKY